MPSTYEPVHLLEPSDLLEPLDLSDRQADLFSRSARPESRESAATSPRGLTPAGRSASAPRSPEGERRSPLKSILMIAGALACFGAGTSLPQFQSFMRGDLAPEPTVGVGQPSAPVADVAAKSEVAAKSDAKSEVAAKSDEAKPTSGEAKPADASSATPSSNDPKADTALNATGTTPPAPNSPDRSGSAVDRAAASAPAPAAPVANDTVAKQRPCPKGDANCLEGGAPSPAKELTNADGTAARLTGPAPAEPVRQAAGPAQSDRQATRAAQPDRQATRVVQPDRQGTRVAQPARPTAGAAQPVRQAASAQQPERVEPRGSNSQEASSSQQQQEAANGQDERARRTKATTQRDARRNVATIGRSTRTQDDTRASESRWDFASDDDNWTSAGRWQNRDGWREREGRRERDGWGERVVDDNVPPARFSGRKENVDRAANWRQDRPSENRWEERNVDRTSNRSRDRYEEYSRDDRRGRSAREADFVMGRAERNDNPLLMIFPFAR
jgi:hypothetical protein